MLTKYLYLSLLGYGGGMGGYGGYGGGMGGYGGGMGGYGGYGRVSSFLVEYAV